MTRFLSLDDVLTMVDQLGLGPVRDIGLLDSAAHRPRTSVFGEDAYPTLDEKVAVLMESIARNHPLIDGNKRLCWAASFAFYAINGIDLEAPHDDAYDLVIGVATGQIPPGESARTLHAWTRPRGA